MPQPIVLGDTSGLSQGISTLGSAIGSVLQKRAEAQQQKKYGDILNTVLSSIPEEASPTDLIRAYSDIASQTSPEFAKGTLDILKPIIQEKVKGAEQRNVLGQLGLSPEGLLGPAVNQQPFTGQPVESPQQNLSRISDNQLLALSSSGIRGLEKLAEAEIKNREFARKGFEAERKFQSGFSQKIEEKFEKKRDLLPQKENALDFARDAVESGQVGAFSKNKLADLLPEKFGDILRTAKGAQLVTASKENLLSNMSRVSARAQNIWFERRLNSMFPKIGQSKEANLTTLEMLESEAAMEKAALQIFDRLAAEDEKNFGFVRKDIGRRVDEALKPINKQIFDRSVYRMRQIEEQELGLSRLKARVGKKVLKGTPMTLSNMKLYVDKFGDKALQAAKANGYSIPTLEEFNIFKTDPREFREQLGIGALDRER